jgi:hypothetical protein
MIHLFLQKFPQFQEQWVINQQRIDGFEKYTEETQGSVSNVEPTTLPAIRRVNELGFFTTDSQDGNIEEECAYCAGFLPRAILGTFITDMQRCNKQIEYIVYPSVTDFSRVVLTKPGTHVPYYKPAEIKTYLVDVVLNGAALDTHNTVGYYRGKKLEPIDIDVEKDWVFILAYDPVFGRPTLGLDGLLTCIERSLKSALSSKGARRRRTKKSRRRGRKTRRNHK